MAVCKCHACRIDNSRIFNFECSVLSIFNTKSMKEQVDNYRIGIKSVVPSLEECCVYILISLMCTYMNTPSRRFNERICTRVK